jgi:hypothetical protein
MKRLVIVGGSGMGGGYALEHPNVERVTSVGRSNLGISHSKLTEVLHLRRTIPVGGHSMADY